MKKLFILLLLVFTSVLANAAESFCNWDHPGTNRYQGRPVDALQDYYMNYQVRAVLQVKMIRHLYDDVVEIRRDGVKGYSNMRDMHYGKGSYCPGRVDTNAWSATQVERGLVYCAASVCVIVPTICNNVSLIDRNSSGASALEFEPLPVVASGTPQPSIDSGQMELRSEPGASISPGNDSSMGEEIGSEGSGSELSSVVVPSYGGDTFGGGGGYSATPPGCDCTCPPGFVGPIGPIPPTHATPAVPEPEEWIMILVGLACFVWCWNRRQR